MRYLNWKSSNGRETVDELDPATFPSRKAYREEAGRHYARLPIAMKKAS